jgi:phenylpyruvate tautomerase PptA (4-oxalocrotonate tautomerase family)
MKKTSDRSNPDDVWITSTWTKRVYSVQKRTLDVRGIAKRKAEAGYDEYQLADFVGKCADLIADHMGVNADGKTTLAEAKHAKATEEVRSLDIKNAVTAGQAKSITDIQVSTASSLRGLTDALETIPNKVRMAVADMDPDDMAIIGNAIIEKRNEAAEHNRSEADGS